MASRGLGPGPWALHDSQRALKGVGTPGTWDRGDGRGRVPSCEIPVGVEGRGRAWGRGKRPVGAGRDPGHERVLGAWEGTCGLVGGPGPKETSEGGVGGLAALGSPPQACCWTACTVGSSRHLGRPLLLGLVWGLQRSRSLPVGLKQISSPQESVLEGGGARRPGDTWNLGQVLLAEW